jgi:dTDP-4-amino-4,6-dideoxygalactose transaminase
LTSTKGQFVRGFEQAFVERYGAGHATACSSGTAAVHTAIAALDFEPGTEIITSPITDMGALAPILYQGCIPVFADVDPETGNVTAETVEARISDRTGAVIVTHLFGNPADIVGIVTVAKRHGIKVIEDCAQAFLARWGDRFVGRFGDIAAFSLQQGKHITTGEGGLVVTDDPALARRSRLYVNKAWGYGDPQPDHEFLALNYRMSELQGAVAGAQLAKLDTLVDRRVAAAEKLTGAVRGIDGLAPPLPTPGATHTYWRYVLRVDAEIIPGGPDALAQTLRGYDVQSAPRYIRKPAFQCRIFTEQKTFGESRWPFTLARPEAVDYSPELFPGTFAALAAMLVLPFNERYDEGTVATLASSLEAAVAESSAGA